MLDVIHGGQAMVANPSFWKDLLQSSVHSWWCAERPLSFDSVATFSKSALMSVFVARSLGVPSEFSYGLAIWPTMAWYVPSGLSYQATLPPDFFTKSSPTWKYLSQVASLPPRSFATSSGEDGRPYFLNRSWR